MDEEEENAGKKPFILGVGAKKDKKPEDDKKLDEGENENEKEKEDENAVTLKHLFKFEFNITKDR